MPARLHLHRRRLLPAGVQRRLRALRAEHGPVCRHQRRPDRRNLHQRSPVQRRPWRLPPQQSPALQRKRRRVQQQQLRAYRR